MLQKVLAAWSWAAALVASPDTGCGPETGCGCNPPLAPGHDSTFTIQSAGGLREYIVWLPVSYDQDNASPLILNFHGRNGTDLRQEALTQLNDTFFNPDHIVVFPQGVPGSKGEPAWTGALYANASVDDLQFTSDLLDRLESTFCIDTSRVFATGKSNGGGFVNYLACHENLARRFTAFAPVAGAYYLGFDTSGSHCKPARKPQPIMEIHGIEDSVVDYGGGSSFGGKLPSIWTWITAWQGRNGCESGAVNHTTLADGVVDVYDLGCNTMHYAVQNADHVWESTVGNEDTDRFGGPSVINASSLVMEFFRNTPSLEAS